MFSSAIIKLLWPLSFAVCCAAPCFAGNVGDEQPHWAAPYAEGIHSIVLPHFEPDLPIAPGRDEFMMVCVSCHSPRYVTMQPPFSAHEWTATVDKMAKNYGAQMDAAQRQAIIGYLVAVNGPDSAAKASAADDDDGASTPQLPRYVETTPQLPFSRDPNAAPEELKHGAELFAQDCASCHGPEGRGNGFVSQALFRKAENLAASRYAKQLLTRVLWNGKRGTAMPSWRELSAADLAALVDYIETFHPRTDSDHPTAEVLQHGRQLFLHNCAPCHGEVAAGKSLGVETFLPQPANFKLKQPDFNYILEVLQDGITGTAMPSWREHLSESDRQDIAVYVRSLFDNAAQ